MSDEDSKLKDLAEIQPPTDMPKAFVLEDQTYIWYAGLSRAKKRLMIDTFLEFKEDIQPIKAQATPIIKNGNRPKLAAPTVSFNLLKKKAKPKRLAIMRWDERSGPISLGNFPQGSSIDVRTFMQIFANYQAARDCGLMSMEFAHHGYVSYFNGSEKNVVIIVMTDPDTDGDAFEQVMVEISKILDAKLDDSPFSISLLEEMFKRFSI